MRGRPFRKGVSPNPGGRPKEVGHLRELARKHTDAAIGTLVAVMKNLKSPPAARVAAASAVLDRGYGRPGGATVRINVPDLASPSDAATAVASVMKAVARGNLAPGDAAALAALVQGYVSAFEATEIEHRLQALEGQHLRETYNEK